MPSPLAHEFGRLVAYVEMDVIEPEALDLVVIGACDDVARRQFHPLGIVFFHIPLAGIGIDQPAALAAHRLGDEEILDLEIVEAGRVELHHFHVRHPRPRPPGHRDPVARGTARRGGKEIDAPCAARCYDRGARDMRDDLAAAFVQRIGAPDPARSRIGDLVAAGDQIDAALPRQQRDIGVFLRCLEQRGLHRPAGRIVHMDDPAMRMPAFTGEVQVILFAVERDPQFAQAVDRGGGALDHEFDRFAVVEPRAGNHRVANVVVEGIARIEHRGDAALRPCGGATVEPALGEDQDLLGFGQRERGGETGGARTDHEDVVRGVCHARVMPIQSLRGKQGTIRRSKLIVGRSSA